LLAAGEAERGDALATWPERAVVGEAPVGAVVAGALLDHLQGGGGHFLGIRAHDLARERVVLAPAGDVVVQLAEVGLGEAASAGEERAIEEGFGDAEGAALAACDDAHGGVGIAGEARLEEGSVKAGDQRGDARVDAARTKFGGDAANVDVLGPGRDGGSRGGGVLAVGLDGHVGRFPGLNGAGKGREMEVRS
jgi:hypothetical protein